MNDYADRNPQHNLSIRPGSTSRPSGRFAPPAQQSNQADPWDQISDEHRSEINDCFSLFDMNKDDALDFSEFRYALQALGFSSIPRSDLISSFNQSPGVVDLRLSREGFQSIAAKYVAARDPREELLKTFGLFDKGGKGVITIEDLRTVVKELGEDVPDNELRSMVEQFDVEDKGGVSREEFLGIFLDR
ncbi:hypothetical protein Micbo1qcDRAFT_121416 [Microdochium bolleyi]|uniref:EF-hand domain-containing protein n=1 Tax=Microdochium bolleyi TaxID=196109 RepID=A0A136IYE3_9PEZI|nr:hypothetical protein Micbo1qcDRAFT_121416 [Microdochium bolleyi]